MSDTDGEATVLEGQATLLLAQPDENEPAIEVKYGQATLVVTRKAMESMDVAIDANSNRPTVFWKAMFVITAVTDILQVDLMEYSTPFSTEEIKQFDWSEVIPGRKDTYPRGKTPTDEEYEKVRCVHVVCKKEKDAQARARGYVKSNVQAYVTLRQKWGQWRDLAAVYKHVYPFYQNQTLLDQMKADLKLLATNDAVDEKLKDVVKKHKEKLSREATKQRQRQKIVGDLKEIERQEDEAKADIAAVEAERAKVQEEIKKADLEFFSTPQGSTRKRTARLKTLQADAAKREEQLIADLEAAREAESRAQEKKRELEEARNISIQEALADPGTNTTKTKKAKRCNIALLDDILSPRKKFALDGAAWKPPTRLPGRGPAKYSKPGDAWSRSNKKKVVILLNLADHLKCEGLLDLPISFRLVNEFMNTKKLSFNERVFIHLVALTAFQHCCFNETIRVLMALSNAQYLSVAEMAAADAPALQATIGSEDEFPSIGNDLHVIATGLEAANGVVPSTKNGLESIGVADCVATQLMQQVFGSTEIVIGLHIRKVMCAIDMIDWEESGASTRGAVKLAKVPASHVRASISTWLPRGSGLRFQESIESLGSAIASSRAGFWGKLTATINAHFGAKDKKELTAMVTSISQFYKATKSGGRRGC